MPSRLLSYRARSALPHAARWRGTHAPRPVLCWKYNRSALAGNACTRAHGELEIGSVAVKA
eukprot:3201293-Pyramimonas_sp.AAC.1